MIRIILLFSIFSNTILFSQNNTANGGFESIAMIELILKNGEKYTHEQLSDYSVSTQSKITETRITLKNGKKHKFRAQEIEKMTVKGLETGELFTCLPFGRQLLLKFYDSPTRKLYKTVASDGGFVYLQIGDKKPDVFSFYEITLVEKLECERLSEVYKKELKQKGINKKVVLNFNSCIEILEQYEKYCGNKKGEE